MSTFTKKILLVFTASTLLMAFEIPEVSAEVSLTKDELITTARKREESLLETPLAITVHSAEDIEIKGLDELTDFVALTPGFYYSEMSVGRGAREFRRLIFRGMQPRTDVQSRQNVTVFIDGAPTLGSELGAMENYERVEVIKGPQSAYFGRATFAGAINAVTKTPGNEWGGKISAEAGSFDLSRFRAEVEGPLVEDKLAFRASGSLYSKGGEYSNGINTSQELGKRSTDDFALTLYATPTENFSAKFRAHYWQDSDGPDVNVVFGPERAPGMFQFNCNPNPAFPGKDWFCGKLPSLNENMIAKDVVYNGFVWGLYGGNPAMADTYLHDVIPDGFGLEREAQELSLVLNYDLSNGINIESITAMHDNEFATLNDVDGRPTVGLMQGSLFGACPGSIWFSDCDNESYQFVQSDLEDFHQEIRLTSSAEDRLRWMVGATYADREALRWTSSYIVGFSPNPASSSSVPRLNFEAETWAIYGSLAYDFTDQLTLNVEMRHQEDEVTEGTTSADQTVALVELTDTFKSNTPRVILEWTPIDGTLLYASYAEGTNPGSFNPGLLNLSPAELAQVAAQTGTGVVIDEEELTMYELGVKSSFWDDRAQITLAGYFGEWEDMLIPESVGYLDDAGDPASVSANSSGGDSDVYGIEVEGSALLTDKLLLDATFAWNKTDINKLGSYEGLTLLGDRDLTGLGKEFSRTPETSGSLSLTYTDALNADYDWFARSDYFYRGEMWVSEANLAKSGDSHVFDLRLGMESDKLRLEFYVTNLFEEDEYAGVFPLFDLSGLSGGFSDITAAAVSLQPRRAVGARASFSF